MKLTTKLTLLSFLLTLNVISVCAQSNPSSTKSTGQIFEINQPDYKLSPKTGMTRQHWKDAAL